MRKIDIIGAGPGNPELLTGAARKALAACDVVIGAERALRTAAGATSARQVALVRSREIVDCLAEDASWGRACVVMTGDTGMFSGAKRLTALLQERADFEVEVHPGVGSAAYLAARLGRPWESWRFASAHGASCDIVAEARRGGTLLLATSNGQTPGELAVELTGAGWGVVPVTVAERLSYPDERVTTCTAEEIAGKIFDDLNVMLVDFDALDVVFCSPDEMCNRWPYKTPGIPDEYFIRGKVPMTKSEIRSVALSKLKIAEGEFVWDVGAGTGSVSVEAALLARTGRVYAIERNPAALELIRKNADAFSCDNIVVVEGTAPQALNGLPAPDAVFVGGSAGQLEAIVKQALAFNPHVRICVTCITIETLAQACALLSGDRFASFDVCQVAVNHADAVGAYHLMRSQNPVFIVSAQGQWRYLE